MYGMLYENGPIRLQDNYSVGPQNYSWDRVADYFWIDQPVGVGFSTVQNSSFVADEDQMGADFVCGPYLCDVDVTETLFCSSGS
jgi:carboxypeptidase D